MNRPTLRKATSPLLAALLLATITTAAAQAEEQAPQPFGMSVIVDKAYGRKVVYGSYDRAIALLESKATHRDQFAKSTNLCVAYAKSKMLNEATVECEAAVAMLQAKQQHIAVREEKRRVHADLAVALSNRGVLHAVSGDKALAKRDFERAIELDASKRSTAEANLNRLRYLPDNNRQGETLT